MRLRELTVQNYGPLEDRSFQFDPRMTVIAGENGRGKSTLLMLLARMLDHLIPQIGHAPRVAYKMSNHDRRVRSVPHGARLNLEVPSAGFIDFRCGGTQPLPRASNSYEELSRTLANEIRRGYGPDPESSRDAGPVAIFYSTERASYPRQVKRLKTASRSQDRANFRALESRSVSFSYIASQITSDFGTKNRERETNPTFLGEQAIASMTRLLEVFLPGFTGLRTEEHPFRIVVTQNGRDFLLWQLSDGQRGLMALVLDLARRLILANPLVADPIRHGSAVVLIDELDLHLHPNWQQTIVEKLLGVFRGCQFVCTTHSPFIVQSLDVNQLINLDGPILNQFSDQGLEEAARFGLKVEVVETSARYKEIFDLASSYFEIVGDEEEKWEGLTNEQRMQAETIGAQLELRTAQVSGDPVYSAFLHQKLARRSSDEAS